MNQDNGRDSFLLNASLVVSLTLMAEVICRGNNYNLDKATKASDLYCDSLQRGLQIQANQLKVNIPAGVSKDLMDIFEEGLIYQNSKIDKEVLESTKYIRDTLNEVVVLICNKANEHSEAPPAPPVYEGDPSSEKLPKAEPKSKKDNEDEIFYLGEKFASYLESKCPNNSEKGIALIRLQECLMWAKESIIHGEDNEI